MLIAPAIMPTFSAASPSQHSFKLSVRGHTCCLPNWDTFLTWVLQTAAAVSNTALPAWQPETLNQTVRKQEHLITPRYLKAHCYEQQSVLTTPAATIPQPRVLQVMLTPKAAQRIGHKQEPTKPVRDTPRKESCALPL